MLFSVVVPMYNAEEFLLQCFESIESQGLRDFEVILVDDGSTDGTLAIAREFADLHPHFRVVAQENGGVSAARNRGLSESQGDYVVFFDADDWVEPTTLETIAKAFDECPADIVVYGGDTFPPFAWANQMLSPQRITYLDNSISALLSETGSRPYAHNKAYRRAMLRDNSITFDESLALGEDQVFQFKAFPFARVIRYIPDKLYHYRQGRTGSAMERFNSDKDVKLAAHYELVSTIKKWWSEYGLMDEYGSLWADWVIRFIHLNFTEASTEAAAKYAPLVLDLVGVVSPEQFDAPTARLRDEIRAMAR